MKLTKSKLREMIREEIKILKEGDLEDAHWNMDKWMPNERDIMDEFYEIFPTPVALYKYKDSVDDELNYLKSIQYISKKS